MTTQSFASARPMRLGSWAACLTILAILAGCGDDDRPRPPVLVPVGGVVRVEGRPLGGAVVMFLPQDLKTGTVAVAETDDAGAYKLTYLNSDGAAAGDYRVTVSYLESTDGKPQGIDARFSPSFRREMVDARERLPASYSSQKETTLRAVVPTGGGSIDFDLVGPMLDLAGPPATNDGK